MKMASRLANELGYINIVGGVNEQNSVVNKRLADDWTAEIAIIASNNERMVLIWYAKYSRI